MLLLPWAGAFLLNGKSRALRKALADGLVRNEHTQGSWSSRGVCVQGGEQAIQVSARPLLQVSPPPIRGGRPEERAPQGTQWDKGRAPSGVPLSLSPQAPVGLRAATSVPATPCLPAQVQCVGPRGGWDGSGIQSAATGHSMWCMWVRGPLPAATLDGSTGVLWALFPPRCRGPHLLPEGLPAVAAHSLSFVAVPLPQCHK